MRVMYADQKMCISSLAVLTSRQQEKQLTPPSAQHSKHVSIWFGPDSSRLLWFSSLDFATQRLI